MVAALAFAQEPPKISPELRARFWRFEAEAIAAQLQLERAKAKSDAARAELANACGTAYQLASDSQGEPVCVPAAKQEQPKK